MNRKEEAISLFKDGFNCSQAVLSVFSDELSIDREMALKIATGFGGGSRNGELCGAVSGALMVLGMKDGHFIKGDNDRKSRSYGLAKEFTDRFKEVQGDIVCKNLLGYDLSNPDEYKILDEKGLFMSECPKYIESAIEVLESMLSSKNL
ncbi:MAG: C-GCAxxG-C-C family protein [Lachnotalea sp.]